jgi:uncharacterized membrane protein
MKILLKSLLVMAALYIIFGLVLSFNPIEWLAAEKILFVVCTVIADMALSKPKQNEKD